MIMEKQETKTEEKGYIKLYKNSRGFNWEIKAYEDMDEKVYDELLAKILKLNEQIQEEFTE